MKNEIVTASIPKRVGSAILDLIVIFLFIILFQNWVVIPVSNSSFKLEELQNNYVEAIVESGLFVEDKNGTIYELRSSLDYDPATKKSTLDDKTYSSYEFYEPYYTIFNSTEYANQQIFENENHEKVFTFVDVFNNEKAKSPLFEQQGNGYVPVANYDNEAMKQFYVAIYDKAYEALYNPTMDMYYLVTDINMISLVGFVISLGISLLIFTLAIPLLRKDGATIGKIMMNLGVVTKTTGFSATKSQTIVRFLAFIFLEIFLSVMMGNFLIAMIGLPLLASFTCVVFTKAHSAIHDYCAATLVVDKSKCVIFNSLEEFQEHERQIQINIERDAYYLGQKTPNEIELDNQANN